MTPPGLAGPPPGRKAQRWVMDTGFSGEAYAWRHYLLEAGLELAEAIGTASCASVFGTATLPLFDADLWLFSNLSLFQDRPFRISLSEGVACRNVASLPNPKANRPLVGMRALRRAGLRVHLDFDADTVSVWIPTAWYRKPYYLVRRALTARVPDVSLWLPESD